MGLFEALPACVEQSLAAVDRHRLEDTDPRARDVGRRLCRAGRREAGCLRRTRCSLSADSAERVVMLGLVNSSLRGSTNGLRPQAQPLTLAQARLLEQLRCEVPQRGEPSVRPEAGEGFEVVRARASDQDGKRRSSHRMESHQLETSWDLRLFALRRTLGLKTCVASEEFVPQVWDERREAQSNPAQLPTPTRVPGNAGRGTHRWSAIDPARPTPNAQPLSSESWHPTSIPPRFHGLDLTGFSATPPLSLKELRTPQALAISIAGNTVRKIYEQCTRRQRAHQEASAAQCKRTRVDRYQGQSVPVQEQASRGDREVL